MSQDESGREAYNLLVHVATLVDRARANSYALALTLAAFVVAQGTLTAITLKLGVTYYGFGYLIACVLTGMLALGVVVHTFQNLTFVTFVLGSLSDPAEAYSSDSKRTI